MQAFEQRVGRRRRAPAPVGEQVELQYQNGWWPVVVKKKERGDKWVVEYEEQITHTVKRDLLRPYLIYNSAGAQWLKGK